MSVAPLGSEELLFANKLYRSWFGGQVSGHLQPGGPGRRARRRTDRRRTGCGGRPGRLADRLTDRRADGECRNLRARTGQMAGSALALPDLGRWPPGADGDCHRHHAAPPCRGAGRPAKRTRPDRQPPDHHGRNGVQRGARAEPAADGHQQLLQRHGVAHQGQADQQRRPAGRAGKNRQAGPARRADHPAHPLLRETQRAQPHARPTWPPWSATPWNWPRSNCAATMCA